MNKTRENADNETNPRSSTESQQAVESIKSAITSTGSFIESVTKKIVSSRTAQSLLKQTSESIDNATQNRTML